MPLTSHRDFHTICLLPPGSHGEVSPATDSRDPPRVFASSNRITITSPQYPHDPNWSIPIGQFRPEHKNKGQQEFPFSLRALRSREVAHSLLYPREPRAVGTGRGPPGERAIRRLKPRKVTCTRPRKALPRASSRGIYPRLEGLSPPLMVACTLDGRGGEAIGLPREQQDPSALSLAHLQCNEGGGIPPVSERDSEIGTQLVRQESGAGDVLGSNPRSHCPFARGNSSFHPARPRPHP